MACGDSITIIIPALNEENNLASAVKHATETAEEFFSSLEIFIFDDGSTDRTGVIADELAKKDSRITAIHHPSPRNLGACYKEGLSLGTHDYVMMVPGDDECGVSVLRAVFSERAKAEIVIPYTSNQRVRPLGRRLLSGAFVRLLNFLAGSKVRYFNGPVLHRSEIVRSCSLRTTSFAYQAEVLVSLLRRGHRYVEIPVEITYRNRGESKALRLNNILQTLHCIVRMIFETLRWNFQRAVTNQSQ